jgi:hypothetical protein
MKMNKHLKDFFAISGMVFWVIALGIVVENLFF